MRRQGLKVSRGLNYCTALSEFVASMPATRCSHGRQDFRTSAHHTDLHGDRAINQAMGRVIRHRHDYGAIILADERFLSEGTRKQISCWLRDSVVAHENFGAATKSLQAFFKVSLRLADALAAAAA